MPLIHIIIVSFLNYCNMLFVDLSALHLNNQSIWNTTERTDSCKSLFPLDTTRLRKLHFLKTHQQSPNGLGRTLNCLPTSCSSFLKLLLLLLSTNHSSSIRLSSHWVTMIASLFPLSFVRHQESSSQFLKTWILHRILNSSFIHAMESL